MNNRNRINKIALILLLTLLLATGIQLGAKEIEGVIQNVHFKTLDIAKIRLKETGKYFYSREGGKFKVQVPDELDSATLVFINSFYYPKTVKIKMDSDLKKVEVLLVPREHLMEEVTVTALSQEEKSVSVPMAESVVTELEIKEKMAENLVETLQHTPGVHFIGSGGFSVTPSIRGIARRRVLLLVDGSRITSDRRAGTSASFIPPEFISRVEVVRSSSSVLYGSDAIGGVVQSFTGAGNREDFGRNSFNISYNTANSRINSGLSFRKQTGKVKLFTAFQYAKAGNYSSPDSEILHSQYTNYSGIFDISMADEKQDFRIYYLGGVGQDIGKPDRSNDPYNYTTAPDDINHIVNFKYNRKNIFKNSNLGIQLYMNPTIYKLEKHNLKSQSLETSDTRALNLGLKLNIQKNISKDFSYRVGVEQYSRTNVDMENSITKGADTNAFFPLKNGKRSDTGLFFTTDYTGISGLDIMAGVRYTFFSSGADVETGRLTMTANSPAAFLGITKKFGKNMTAFINLGRAYRTPSLSEAFYTGLTGRKYVIANPNLVAEKSFNVDAGLKIFSKKLFLGIYVFSSRINNMIERFKNEEGIYTHDNIQAGIIQGAELEFQAFPSKNLELFGHYFYYIGKSKVDDVPLNDIPAPRLFLGGKLMLGKFWCELNFSHAFKKDNPGPAEIFNDDFNVLDLKAGYYLSGSLFLYLKGSNLLNETYYANPDPDIPLGKQMDISAGINFYF